MAQTPNPKNPKNFKQPNRTNVVTIIVFLVIGVFFLFMMGRTMTSATGVTQTDELQTSEFMQAVEQGRVSTAVYDTGSYFYRRWCYGRCVQRSLRCPEFRVGYHDS